MGKSTKPLRTAVLTFGKSREQEWQSLNEIFPSIDRAWAASRAPSHRVDLISLESAMPLQLVPALLACDRIVFPQFALLSPAVHELVGLLRRSFGSGAQLIFHLHGDGTKAARSFEPLKGLLRSNDGFVAASRADAKAFRLCYPRARVLVAPFALARGRERPSRRAGPTRLWYCGRVSEQKNLHTLLLAFQLLRASLDAREARVVELEIFGASDGHGSPNMGLRYRRYGAYLRTLCRELGIESAVRWHGFLRAPELIRRTRRSRHVLVSASLHSDENFGVAALRSLLLGNRAVLSAWGGHLDFKRHFASQVRLVPAVVTGRGPFVDPAKLARALRDELVEAPAERASRAATPYRAESVARLLREFSAALPKSGAPLEESALLRALAGRRSKTLFQSYADPLARPFFEAFASKTSRRERVSEVVALRLPPWVRVTATHASVDDPHRGTFRKRVEAKRARTVAAYDVHGRKTMVDGELSRWLLESGWAFDAGGR